MLKIGSESAAFLAPLIQHLTRSAGPILVATLWQGMALAAITALCLRLAPYTTAALRFSLWAAALFLICLLPFAPTRPFHSRGAPFHLDPRWSLVLAAVWLTLSLLRAADLVRHAFRLRALSGQASPVALDPPIAALLQVHRRAQIRTSTQLERPGVIGFLRPRILIPAWLFDQLTVRELEQIVLHELEHLRRRDDWLNLVQKLALVLFPLNPALHWIDRRLCLERELACDEGVVRRTRAPRLYASCLARLAEHGLDRRAFALALGFLEHRSALGRRVAGILRAPRTLSASHNLSLAGVIAVLLLGGSAELARCPQLVSFAPAAVSLATQSGAPRFGPETWVSRSGAVPVLYTGATAPRLVRASLRHVRKPLRKARLRRVHPAVPAQRVLAGQTVPVELLATDLTQPAAQAPITPTLVRYTLVHVDGGWLFLQL